MSKKALCPVCFRQCELEDGQFGPCLARVCREGKVLAENYGKITALALDPIEKKPLYHFFPGSRILSLGSYGCNLFCPFCQNCEISRAFEKEDQTLVFQKKEGDQYLIPFRKLSPEEARDLALSLRDKGNIGIAFTYNEPLVGYEYVRDTARLVKKAGMKTVLVTNGEASQAVLDELLPYIDAMNIDLKAFRERTYREILGGDLKMLKNFIERAAEVCHVEITSLIVPGLNDRPQEVREMAKFIRSLRGGKGESIYYHLSRYFPRYQMLDRPPTDPSLLYRLKEEAEKELQYVFLGNL